MRKPAIEAPANPAPDGIGIGRRDSKDDEESEPHTDNKERDDDKPQMKEEGLLALARGVGRAVACHQPDDQWDDQPAEEDAQVR